MTEQTASVVYDPQKFEPQSAVTSFAEGGGRFRLKLESDSDVEESAPDTSNDFTPPAPPAPPVPDGSGAKATAASGGDFEVGLDAPE